MRTTTSTGVRKMRMIVIQVGRLIMPSIARESECRMPRGRAPLTPEPTVAPGGADANYHRRAARSTGLRRRKAPGGGEDPADDGDTLRDRRLAGPKRRRLHL